MIQTQRIGQSKGKRRVTLWNRALNDAGFPAGTRIAIVADTVAHNLTILPNRIAVPDPSNDDGFTLSDIEPRPRKVSSVLNHGKRLPVIDLKEGKKLDLSHLGDIGGSVTVSIQPGIITITRKAN